MLWWKMIFLCQTGFSNLNKTMFSHLPRAFCLANIWKTWRCEPNSAIKNRGESNSGSLNDLRFRSLETGWMIWYMSGSRAVACWCVSPTESFENGRWGWFSSEASILVCWFKMLIFRGVPQIHIFKTARKVNDCSSWKLTTNIPSRKLTYPIFPILGKGT